MQQTPYCYVIKVQKHLNCEWLVARVNAPGEHGYDGAGAPVTTITVQVGDQAELLDLLHELRDNGIRIQSIRDMAYCRTK
jgi:hypothetical protein